MKLATLLVFIFASITTATSFAERTALGHSVDASLGSVLDEAEARTPDERLVVGGIPAVETLELSDPSNILERRRGGGGGGGGGSRGGGGGGGGGTSGGSKSGGGSTSTGGSKSNSGGRTITGSGTAKIGGYYGGGGAVPFKSGGRTTSGIIPAVLAVSLVSTFFSGGWMYGSLYGYPFTQNVYYYNKTSSQNETLPVLCLCQEYSVCGCDENHNQTYIDQLMVNATANPTNGMVVGSKIVDVNGTRTLVVNGTLDNGTTSDGGTVAVSGAMGQGVGLLILAAMVGLGVSFA